MKTYEDSKLCRDQREDCCKRPLVILPHNDTFTIMINTENNYYSGRGEREKPRTKIKFRRAL